MIKNTAYLMIFAILLCVHGGVAVADDAQTLTGEYVWTNRDSRGALEAIFSPAGQDTWDVAFHFKFQGEKHVYTGTAEGNLSEGELKGTVLNENKKRTFTFQGRFEDGIFRGTHSEISDGEKYSTGTLTLSE